MPTLCEGRGRGIRPSFARTGEGGSFVLRLFALAARRLLSQKLNVPT